MQSAIDVLLTGRRRDELPDAEIVEHAKTICTGIGKHLATPSAASNKAIDSAAAALHFAAARITIPEIVTGLLQIAEFCYVSGRAVSGVASTVEAVGAARKLSEGELLRKALYFQGILMADTGNLPRAIECYAEALDLSIAARDRLAEAKVWNNTGGALIYAAQYGDAIACFERAIALYVSEPALAHLVEAPYGNIALACLHLEDYGKGLRAAVHATENGTAPTSPPAMFARVLAESHYTRLLLEVGAIDKAKERAEIAKQLAARSGLERAQLVAAMTEGLYEVHALKRDVGLSRLQQVLEKARETSKGSLRDALIAIYKAHELAGKHDLAFMYLRELMLVTKRVQEETALFHHRLHLEQIEKAGPRQRVADASVLLERQEQELRNKLARQIAEQELLRSRIEMLERLAVTAELRDDATGEHSYRVGKLASLLAKEAGFEDHKCFVLELGARLHDIGKVGIPDGVLLKPARLNESERHIMQTHTNAGADILAKSDIPDVQVAEDIARFHHEWYNGTGYPFGIGGTAIPASARITALADVFDALTHARPYKPAWTVDQALEEIARLSGQQFDPEYTKLFLRLVPQLQREHGDLDEFLSSAARQSPFLRARKRITGTLRQYEAEQQQAGQDSVPRAVD